MPTYVYECGSCNQTLEIEQRMADEPLKTCPACKKSALKRVIQPVGIAFKGTGFYVNDSGAPAGPAVCDKPDGCACKPSSDD